MRGEHDTAKGGAGQQVLAGETRADITQDRIQQNDQCPWLTCNSKENAKLIRITRPPYLIAAPILGSQFKAGFFLGVFSKVGSHPDTVAFNEEGPFRLLACKIAKLPVSPERHNSEGKASSLVREIKSTKQLLHPRGTTIV